MALDRLMRQGAFTQMPLREPVAAISVGILDNELLLDLCYEEDSQAGADFNVVMTGSGDLVEVQGTAEGATYSRQQFDEVLDLAQRGIESLGQIQAKALEKPAR